VHEQTRARRHDLRAEARLLATPGGTKILTISQAEPVTSNATRSAGNIFSARTLIPESPCLDQRSVVATRTEASQGDFAPEK
jgi:hypothetical protein